MCCELVQNYAVLLCCYWCCSFVVWFGVRFGLLGFQSGRLDGIWTGIGCGRLTADIFVLYWCGKLELSSMIAVPRFGFGVIRVLWRLLYLMLMFVKCQMCLYL